MFQNVTTCSTMRTILAGVALNLLSLSLPAHAGEGTSGGGGGSHVQLIRYMGAPHVVFDNPAIYLHDLWWYHGQFEWHAFRGIRKLEALVNNGAVFHDRAGRTIDVRLEHIDALKELLERFNRQAVLEGRFRVAYALQDSRVILHMGRNAAENNPDGRITINPLQMEYIGATFVPEIAQEIYDAIAVHELASQPSVALEHTNYYPVVSQIAQNLRHLIATDVRKIYRPEIVEDTKKKIRQTAYEVARTLLNPKTVDGRGRQIDVQPEVTVDWDTEFESSTFEIESGMFSYWRGTRLSMLPFDTVTRIHELMIKKVTPGRMALTTMRHLDSAMNALVFNTLPPIERRLFTMIGKWEDETGLSCFVRNGSLNELRQIGSTYASTTTEPRSWTLTVRCRTLTHERRHIVLTTLVDARNQDGVEFTVTSDQEIDQPVIFEPHY